MPADVVSGAADVSEEAAVFFDELAAVTASDVCCAADETADEAVCDCFADELPEEFPEPPQLTRESIAAAIKVNMSKECVSFLCIVTASVRIIALLCALIDKILPLY